MNYIDRALIVSDLSEALRGLAPDELDDPHARGVAYARARPSLSLALLMACDADAAMAERLRRLAFEVRAAPLPMEAA